MILKRLWNDIARHRALWLMIFPTLLFFLIFSYLPMVGIYFAFTDYKFQLGYFGSPFVGFKNFSFLFRSGILGSLTMNTVLYNLAFIVFQNLCQVICAIFLNDLRSRRFVRISQTIIFLPYFISMVLVGVFAYNMLNIDNGIINTLLKSLGMAEYNFYMKPHVWPAIIVFAHVWKGLGYGTIIYLSALTGVNPEYYETARIDGATKWQQIRFITLPMLMPTIALLVMFSLGSIMKGQFELFYQLIGRNGILYAATDIIDTYVYRSLMVNFNIGMGTAAGLYQSVFGFAFVMTVNWLVRRYEQSYALF